jgi:hypothetical protein
MSATRRSEGPDSPIRQWAEPCPTCDGSGELRSAREGAPVSLPSLTGTERWTTCQDCDGSGLQIPAGLQGPMNGVPGLARDELVVESLELLTAQQAWRVELIRGPGGESLRLSGFDPRTGAIVPTIFDETLAQRLQAVLSEKNCGGIRRVLDTLSRSWTRRSGR